MLVEDLQRRVDKISGIYEGKKKQEASLSEEVDSIKVELSILNKTGEVFKHVMDFMVRGEISKMSGLITYGLKTVFDDQDLSFVPVITKKGNKIHIELKTMNGEIEGGVGSIGGSIAVIESFLLRILFILKMSFAKFILLDETFAAVGEEYIPNTSKLIAELSHKLGMDILLVTHQKEFQDYADNTYRVRESKDGLLISRVGGKGKNDS